MSQTDDLEKPRRTGRPLKGIRDGVDADRLRCIDAMLAYLAEELGAGDAELRAYARHSTGLNEKFSLYDLRRLRRSAGVTADTVQSDRKQALSVLTEFYTESRMLPKFAALAHLRKRGLAVPGHETFEEAKRAARRARAPMIPFDPEEVRQIMSDAACDYIAQEPGATNGEIRSYVWSKTKIRALITGTELRALRLDVGVQVDKLRTAPQEAFAMLCGFYRQNPGAPKYAALAHLRKKGLRSPGRDLFHRAKVNGREYHAILSRDKADSESPTTH